MKMKNIYILALFADCGKGQLYCSTKKYDESKVEEESKALESDIASGIAGQDE